MEMSATYTFLAAISILLVSDIISDLYYHGIKRAKLFLHTGLLYGCYVPEF